jgi:hypothetical protein
VDLLLRRGAPVNVRDDVYKTPPIVWALQAWLVEHRYPAEPYKTVIRALAAADVEVKPEWIDDERLRADPELYASLRRRADESDQLESPL